MLRDGKWADGRALTAADYQQVRRMLEQNRRVLAAHQDYTAEIERADKAVADKAYAKADELAAGSARDIARAKEGLGTLGGFAVDLGVQGVQMAGDVAASAMVPGAGLALMGLRSGGSAAQEARQAGATYGQQLAYGVGSGALSMATEKIANVAAPFKTAFGGALANAGAEKLLARFGENQTVRIMSQLAKTAGGKLILSAISEGGEEVVEDLVQPILQRATYNPDAKFDAGGAFYDFLMGAAMGGIGAGVEQAGNRVRRLANAGNGPENVAGAPVETGADVTAGPAQSGAEGMKNAASGTETANDIRVGQVTTIKRPYRGEVPVQTQRQNTAPVQVSKDSLTAAQNRIAGAQGLEKSLPGMSFKGTLKNVYKKVFKPATGVPVEGATFKGQPYTVDINNTVPGKVISDPNLTAEKLALLDNLSDVVRDGTYVGSGEYVPHSERKKLTVRFDYFETPVTIDGNRYIASFDVEVFPNTNNYRTHKLNKMELSPIANADVGPAPTASVVEAAPVEGMHPLDSDNIIAQGAETVKNGGGRETSSAGDTPERAARYDNLGSARQGFTTPGMEGSEQISRLADSMPYNPYQKTATALSREDYTNLFRYESQTEGRSLHLAEELVYAVQNGKKKFLRDIDERAFQELVQSLDDATAWNGPQMDAARMIQRELQGKSVNSEITEDEYINFLKIMREHETATGQGVQANAKWSRDGNSSGQSTELDAWNNLNKSNLSFAEKQNIFQRIVKWDAGIGAVEPGDSRAMKDIILDVAKARGVLNGVFGRDSKMLLAIADSSLDALTFDQMKQFAYASTSAMSTDATATNLGRRVKTIQVLNMLSNPKTAAKNITGNTSFYALDALSMKGAALLDMAVSKATGTRSMAADKIASRATMEAAVKAVRMSIAEITMDVDMDGVSSRYGTGSQRTFKASGNFAERVLSALERNQAYLLNATDEFYKGAARSSEASTQRLIDLGKIKTTDKNYAKAQAEQLARYRTFQDDSKASIAIQEIHDVLNLAGIGDSGKTIKGQTVHAFGVGDVVAPFTRVAGNLISRGVEYSPVNAVKGTVEIAEAVAKAVGGGNADLELQSKGVSDLARGMTGTVIAYGFMGLVKLGLMRKAEDEDDEKVAAMNRAAGMTGTQLNLSAAKRLLSGGGADWQDGDILVDLSSVEPLNLLMDLGAEMAKDGGNPILSSFRATPKSLLSASAELPVVQFAGNVGKDVLKYGKDPTESLIKHGASTVVSSVIPNVVRAVAQGMDDRPRSTSYADSFMERVKAEAKGRVPGLRQTLPGSVDSLGQDRMYQGTTPERLFNAMLNPVGVNHYQQGEVSQELERLREETGDTSFYPANTIPKSIEYTDKDGNKHSVSMDYEQRQDFQRERGIVTGGTMLAMMGTPAYQTAKPEQQAELMDKCREYGYEVAKGKVLGKGAMAVWARNAQTAKQDIGLSTVEYLEMYQKYGRSIMSGDGYETAKEALDAGLSIDEYASYKSEVKDLTADKDANGNSIDGSKKAKVLEAINGMNLSAVEKDWLYYLNGYSAKSINEAPWH